MHGGLIDGEVVGTNVASTLRLSVSFRAGHSSAIDPNQAVTINEEFVAFLIGYYIHTVRASFLSSSSSTALVLCDVSFVVESLFAAKGILTQAAQKDGF